MQRRRNVSGPVLGFLAVLSGLCGAATTVVDALGGGAFTTIQPAIDAAADGDTILVMPGTYEVTAPITFKGRVITVISQDGPAETTIRMASAPENWRRASVVIFEKGEDTRSVLEGFTVIGGQGTEWGSGFNENGGGGILCINGSRPMLRGLIVADNKASTYGGGISCDAGGAAWVKGCVFRGNFAYKGGGVHTQGNETVFEDCEFDGNQAPHGGGGGIYSRGVATLINCTFFGNIAGDENGFSRDGGGGGLYNENAHPRVIGCVFSGNRSYENFGAGIRNFGVSNPSLVNCTVSGNSAPKTRGGGMYSDEGGSPVLVNCILWDNRDKDGTVASSQLAGGTPDVRYCCIQDGDPDDGEIPFGGAINHTIDDDPFFLDPDGTDGIVGTVDDNLRLRQN